METDATEKVLSVRFEIKMTITTDKNIYGSRVTTDTLLGARVALETMAENHYELIGWT